MSLIFASLPLYINIYIITITYIVPISALMSVSTS